jgi:hypothetical protein
MTRSREIIELPNNGGDKCGHLEETEECNTHKCPVDCKGTDCPPQGECPDGQLYYEYLKRCEDA